MKRFSYVQKFAWIKNSSNAYVSAPTAVWLLAEERTCQKTATIGNACAGGSIDEIVKAYDYGADAGPNNRQLRSITVTASNGLSSPSLHTLRTCYTYDIYGNRVSETKPKGATGGCP